MEKHIPTSKNNQIPNPPTIRSGWRNKISSIVAEIYIYKIIKKKSNFVIGSCKTQCDVSHTTRTLLQSSNKLASKTKPISLIILVHKHRCLNIRCYINEIALNKTKAELFISALHKTQWNKVILVRNTVKFQDTISSRNLTRRKRASLKFISEGLRRTFSLWIQCIIYIACSSH